MHHNNCFDKASVYQILLPAAATFPLNVQESASSSAVSGPPSVQNPGTAQKLHSERTMPCQPLPLQQRPQPNHNEAQGPKLFAVAGRRFITAAAAPVPKPVVSSFSWSL